MRGHYEWYRVIRDGDMQAAARELGMWRPDARVGRTRGTRSASYYARIDRSA